MTLVRSTAASLAGILALCGCSSTSGVAKKARPSAGFAAQSQPAPNRWAGAAAVQPYGTPQYGQPSPHPEAQAPAASVEQRFRSPVEAGIWYEQSRNDRLARNAYLEALRTEPNSAFAHQRLGAIADRAGQFQEAEGHYLRALAASPNDPSIYNDLGYSYYLSNRLGEAEQALRTALRLAPQDLRAHNNLGLVLGRQGRQDDALAAFRAAGATENEAVANLAFVESGNQNAARSSPSGSRAFSPSIEQAAFVPPQSRRFDRLSSPTKQPIAAPTANPVMLTRQLQPAE